MINVKFFGTARIKLGVSAISVQAKNINQLLQEIVKLYPIVSIKDMKNFFIYVNGTNISKLKKYRSALSDGDQVIFLSPASGG